MTSWSASIPKHDKVHGQEGDQARELQQHGAVIGSGRNTISSVN